MNKERRKFLKIILIGSGTFIMGKIFSPLFLKFLNNSNSSAKTNSSTFQIVENKKGLSIYDDYGEEIFQIDNGA